MERLDPFTQDPIRDIEYPATQSTFSIDSHGSILNAMIEIAQGKGPHGTIILLHGFPGNEKNIDLAHIFRRSGFNVIIFYYRGSWGSGGKYSFQNCIEDLDSVVSYLQDPQNTVDYRIDLKNIILIGHSWGGFVALFAGIKNNIISRIVSISGFNIGRFGKSLEENDSPDDVLYELMDDVGPLQGTSGQQLINEIIEMRNSWDLVDIADQLIMKDVCLTGALNDEVLPIEIHHYPLVKSIENISNLNLRTQEFNTTHSYSDHRLALARYLLSWLKDPKILV